MRTPALALAALLVALLAGCGGSQAGEEAAREQIQEMLETYLPVLGQAYATGDALVLSEWVAQKEVARVGKRLVELEEQGRRLEPVFNSVTVESVEIWGNSNAFAVTLESWSITSYALGSDRVLQQAPEQSSRVRYQLKKDDGRWRVLFRTISD